jgi:WD40 repeat protein
MISCAKDNKIILWDLTKKDDKGKPFRGHKAPIEDCDLAPGA